MAESEEETTTAPKRSGLKIALIIIIPLLLISSTVAGLYLGGVFGGGDHGEDNVSKNLPMRGPFYQRRLIDFQGDCVNVSLNHQYIDAHNRRNIN